MVLMDSSRLSENMGPFASNSDVAVNEMLREEKGDNASVSCDYYDLEQVRRIVQALHSGLACACVVNTMGDLFKTPASVAPNLKKELVEYLQQQSKAYATEYLSSLETLDSPESPIEVIDDLLENFVYSKRSLFTRVSGWLLSEQEDDKVDDFDFEMNQRGFWVKGQREVLAKELLKFIDLNNTYHCEMKLESSEELELHRNRCPFQPLHCINEGCKEVFCAVYAKEHDASCPLKLIPCEQNCSAIVNRAEMDKHCLTGCPMKLVNCPFYQVGCQSTIHQASIEKHCAEFLQSHIHYVLKSLHKYEGQVGDLSDEVLLLDKYLSPIQKSEAVNIRSLSLIIKEHEERMNILEHDAVKLQQDTKFDDISA